MALTSSSRRAKMRSVSAKSSVVSSAGCSPSCTRAERISRFFVSSILHWQSLRSASCAPPCMCGPAATAAACKLRPIVVNTGGSNPSTCTSWTRDGRVVIRRSHKSETPVQIRLPQPRIRSTSPEELVGVRFTCLGPQHRGNIGFLVAHRQRRYAPEELVTALSGWTHASVVRQDTISSPRSHIFQTTVLRSHSAARSLSEISTDQVRRFAESARLAVSPLWRHVIDVADGTRLRGNSLPRKICCLRTCGAQSATIFPLLQRASDIQAQARPQC